MARAAVLLLLLSGCTVIEHVQVLPVIDQKTDAVTCCITYVELSRTAGGSIQIQNTTPKGYSAKVAAHWKF